MKQVVYTVYRITNLLNDKYYVGKHKTTNPNDAYYGSGRAIKKAIAKYGKQNFRKEVLLITECETEAFEFERQMTANFNSRDTYNLRLGGPGGFDAAARARGNAASIAAGAQLAGGRAAVAKKAGAHALTSKDHASNGRKGGRANAGKPKSDAHKQAMREAYYRRIAQR
ncbi:GIY-YIG nuclease family protein [bacterium]|nr:GIY-YIG nuclease family protein [bacterium]